ncbi:MAG: type II toxin-antitoxin system prevent-host-death family antitoxin [Verrucomicrobiota bacterium]
MQEFPSTDAKDRWGIITDTALQEPVTITKHGRPTLVITSAREYEELQRIKYEALKSAVSEGFEQLDRGEVSSRSMDEIKAEARKAVKKSS